VICTRCDRGQRYCGLTCRSSARRRTLREAGRRYQLTALGRRNNAARQRRWRAVRRWGVTHQGSPTPALPVSLPASGASGALDEPTERSHASRDVRALPPSAGVARCHFCGRPCGAFTRTDFLLTPAPRAWWRRGGA